MIITQQQIGKIVIKLGTVPSPLNAGVFALDTLAYTNERSFSKFFQGGRDKTAIYKQAAINRKDNPLLPISNIKEFPAPMPNSASFWCWFAGLYESCATLEIAQDKTVNVVFSFISLNREIICSLISFLGVGYLVSLNGNKERFGENCFKDARLFEKKVPEVGNGLIFYKIYNPADIGYIFNKILPYIRSPAIILEIKIAWTPEIGVCKEFTKLVSPNLFGDYWLAGFLDGGARLAVHYIFPPVLKPDAPAKSVVQIGWWKLTPAQKDLIITEIIPAFKSGGSVNTSKTGINSYGTEAGLSIYKVYNYLVKFPLRTAQYVSFKGAWSKAVRIFHQGNHNKPAYLPLMLNYILELNNYYFDAQVSRWTPYFTAESQRRFDSNWRGNFAFTNHWDKFTGKVVKRRGLDEDFTTVLDVRNNAALKETKSKELKS